MRVEDLRPLPLFDGLTDEQLAALLADGAEVAVEPGRELFHEGDPADHWWVLVDGTLDLLRHVGREDTVVGRMDVPGRWAGGFRAWDEHGVYLATGRGAEPGRVLSVPATALRSWTNAWFPLGVHLLVGVFGTARSIESTVRQRASLVTLGRLAAGLAHEINNPAAATTRAVEALDTASRELLGSLSRLAHDEITPQQFLALDALRLELGPGGPEDPLARADAEEALGTWLDRHGVADPWDVAASLAAAGADPGWCARVDEALGGAGLGPALTWVASTMAVGALVAEARESTRRVSELVASVRSYSQMDRASRQAVDVTEGIESTLVMLGHKLRGGVTVRREYDATLPRLEAYPGELNQVWTNLVDNAVDAMDGRGTLTLRTRLDGDTVVVEVADTGEGMTPAVAARAFDAFFTTKDVGKGTGLGLDIARRIVEERHGGEISIESSSGATTLRVRLPLLPARGG